MFTRRFISNRIIFHYNSYIRYSFHFVPNNNSFINISSNYYLNSPLKQKLYNTQIVSIIESKRYFTQSQSDIKKAEELQEQGMNYFDEGNYQKSIEHLLPSIKIIKNNIECKYKTTDSIIHMKYKLLIMPLIILAKNYHLINDLRKAENTLKELMNILENNPNSGMSIYFNVFSLYCEVVFQKGKENELFNFISNTFTKILNNETKLYNLTMVPSERELYEDVFNHISTKYILVNASIRPKQYLEFFKALLTFYESKIGSDSKTIIYLLQRNQYLYEKINDYDNALQCAMKALALVDKYFDNNSLEKADALNYLADIQQSMENRDEAINNFKRAEEIYQLNGADKNILISISNSLASIYLVKNQPNISLQYFQKSKEIKESISNENDSGIGNIYGYISYTYSLLKDYNKAIEYGQKAIEIFTNIHGVNHDSVAHALSNLGSYYYESGKINEAKYCHKQALEIFEKLYGKKHKNIARSLEDIAYCFRKKILKKL